MSVFDQPLTQPILALVGPTAIGKTSLSLAMAESFPCEIVSMDSMQVYRFMDIGTAKASTEERRRIPHHLIDIVDPDEQYDAGCFVRDALRACTDIHSRGKIPLITGGTGMYLSRFINGIFDDIKVHDSIRNHLRSRLADEGREVLHRELQRVDPESGQRIHVNDTQRLLRGLEVYAATGIPWSEHLRRQNMSGSTNRFSRLLILGLTCDRTLLHERIKERSIRMMSEAFAKEVEDLLARGYRPDLHSSMRAIGYRHMCAWLGGQWDKQTAITALISDTRRYAKRQMTWFRNQHQIRWFDIDQQADAFAALASFLIGSSAEHVG